MVRLFCFLLALAGMPCARAALTVAVYNYAGISAATLSQALHTAQFALRSAGIESSWAVCNATSGVPDECSQPLPPFGHYVEMLVMPRGVRFAGTGTRDVAGLALQGRLRAYAFYSVAESTAELDLRSPALVLASIFVHEIGHLLGLSHQTRRGIMRPNLHVVDMDKVTTGWAFDAWESQRLRAAADGLR